VKDSPGTNSSRIYFFKEEVLAIFLATLMDSTAIYGHPSSWLNIDYCISTDSIVAAKLYVWELNKG
tara:strand:- start:192 stop:389 length:198 start_codon:yes stop_codon:yes gene_type:complete